MDTKGLHVLIKRFIFFEKGESSNIKVLVPFHLQSFFLPETRHHGAGFTMNAPHSRAL